MKVDFSGLINALKDAKTKIERIYVRCSQDLDICENLRKEFTDLVRDVEELQISHEDLVLR